MRSFKHLKTYHLLPILLLATTLLAGLILPTAIRGQTAGQIDLPGPDGSGQFGQSVTVLPNGNVVVTDPYYDTGSVTDVGAVYLYNGATHALISTLVGSVTNDQVGSGGVTVLDNGNYVVSSPKWNNDRGAVTWGNGSTGVSGPVSINNSLVGSVTNDRVGSGDVAALDNGNYVVCSPFWNGDKGAVTWVNGATGISGAVSITNSLVGGAAYDRIGFYDVILLNNGNYVITNPYWDNGPVITDAGAVTWGNGSTGISGLVSTTNSLVGSTINDLVGYDGITPLSNGNYVVRSIYWDNGAATTAGAVTWGNGSTGISGAVSITNSLVGSAINDLVGNITALSNSNYVVYSPKWDNGAATDAGAVTWGNGSTGISGAVSITNSLVGSVIDDMVGNNDSSYDGVTALSNGNYVVRSPYWDNGATTDVGAVTWVNGTTGISGAVSTANSLMGNAANDQVGYGGITALSNGNYVVSSPYWNNGAATNAGAITWGNGSTGLVSAVSTANSLIGSAANDQIGYDGVTALSNGNYVVRSIYWDNGATTNVGAVTWGNGSTGLIGVISSTNSLVGGATDDQVGYDGVIALSNGNYVVKSRFWDNSATTGAGAITWGNGSTGIVGVVSSTNSLVGGATDDLTASHIVALSNGNYVVLSPKWDNGAVITDAGAVTWGNGGIVGTITAENSVRGTAANGGDSLVFAYNEVHHQLIVGRPADNIVTFFDCKLYVYLPVVVK